MSCYVQAFPNNTIVLRKFDAGSFGSAYSALRVSQTPSRPFQIDHRVLKFVTLPKAASARREHLITSLLKNPHVITMTKHEVGNGVLLDMPMFAAFSLPTPFFCHSSN
jgi:hypothetical protein